ncbi:Hsp20/alpha crystallin family protein [bacterium]|nr:MAG: Hsp20/alpha crystallin family protein [bacterium]
MFDLLLQKIKPDILVRATEIDRLSDKVKKQSGELLAKLKEHKPQNERFLQHLHDEVKTVFTYLKQSSDWLEHMVNYLEKEKERRYLLDFTCKFNVTEKKEANYYLLSVNLPGFQKENMNFNVQGKDHQAIITAEKRTPQNDERFHYSESYFSSQTINGRTKKIEYKDGNLKIIADLPNNVDVKNFTSTIDEEKATINFQIKTTETKQIDQK